MNKKLALISFAAVALASCAINEPENTGIFDDNAPVFYASFEDSEATKTFVDEQLHLFWTADDRLSIFNSTYNQQYKFKGNSGDISGAFGKVITDEYVTGSDLSTNYAVYPYDPDTQISYEELISLNLPTVQRYAEKSFGLGANTMVAVTDGRDDNFLPFKNLCGYLVIQLYGSGSIKSISIGGNNGEKIAGKAQVTAVYGEDPVLTMDQNATGTITIDCGEGIALGATSDEATEFWFCIPPVTFENGFTITATDTDGWYMTKSVSSSKTITRNVKVSMTAVKTECGQKDGYVEFEDTNFKAYCVENFDTDGDGEISFYEAEEIKLINVNTDNISSLVGIEAFRNLSSLSCVGSWHPVEGKAVFDGQLTNLDVSKNTKLVDLFCGHNQLTSLDVSKNPELRFLDCEGNQLTSLNVTNNLFLKNLVCQENPLGSIDLSNNTALSSIYCDNCNLTSLDISHNTELSWLECNSNQLANLDVSNNTKLLKLRCFGNKLTYLDISNNKELNDFSCAPMNDANGHNVLEYLFVSNGQYVPGVTEDRNSSSIPDETIIVYEGQPLAVDLGLSVKWASINLGAGFPWDYGDLYAWGETEAKESFGKNNYKWYDSELAEYTKYTDNDSKYLLDEEDDAARAVFKGDWRMPTIQEIDELVQNCSSECVTINGMEGRLVTSNINGKTIFLPAAGYNTDSVGLRGYFWSSSHSGYDEEVASCLSFSLEIDDCIKRDRWYREYGMSIRPVCE